MTYLEAYQAACHAALRQPLSAPRRTQLMRTYLAPTRHAVAQWLHRDNPRLTCAFCTAVLPWPASLTLCTPLCCADHAPPQEP